MMKKKQPKKISILLVDDNNNFLSCFKRIFVKQAFEIVYCNDPVEALTMIKERIFDFIISDEQMPSMSGTQLLIKARSIQPAAQRILITGEPNLDSSVKAINESAVCGMLIKPFNASKLLEIINQNKLTN